MATPPRNCQAVYWGMPGAATTSRTNFRNPPNPTHLSEPNTLARPAFQRWNWRSKNNWLWPQQIGIWVWSDQTWSNYTPNLDQILQPFSNQICLHFHRRPLRKLLTRTEPSRVLHATHEIHWQLGASHRWSAPYELIPHGRFNLLPCCLPFRSFRIAEKMWENAWNCL